MIDALKTVAALLHKYGSRRAGAVEALLRAAEAKDPNLDLDLCGDELWGEEGLWDSGPQVLQRPRHDHETCRADEMSYRQAFLDLAAKIDQVGAGTPAQRERVRAVASLFRTWERDGL